MGTRGAIPDDAGAVEDDGATLDIGIHRHFKGDNDVATRWYVTIPLHPVIHIVIDNGWCRGGFRAGHKGGAAGNWVDHGDAKRRCTADIGDDHGVLNRATRGDNRGIGLFIDADDRLIRATNPDLGFGTCDRRALGVDQFGGVDNGIVTAPLFDGHLEFDRDTATGGDIASPLDPVVGIVIDYGGQR